MNMIQEKRGKGIQLSKVLPYLTVNSKNKVILPIHCVITNLTFITEDTVHKTLNKICFAKTCAVW